MSLILAAATLGGMSIVEIGITIVIIAAVIAIVFAALKAYEIPVPAWLWQILTIVLVAVVAILALKFVASL